MKRLGKESGMSCGVWRLDREIGHGAYGVVYLAVGTGGECAAVKVCNRAAVGDERYARELRGAKLYRSIPPQEGLVRMRGLGETEWGFYTVMDLADDEFGASLGPSEDYRPKTLARVIEGEKALPLKECVGLALSLAKGLDALQRHHLLHRDIKPGNVLYVKGQPVLSDPGLLVEESKAASLVGTPGFVPPEKFTEAASDIYSLGLTLKAASFGRQLEDLDKGPALEADTGAALFPVWWRILNKATDPTPSRRYQSAKALIKALKSLCLRMEVSSRLDSRMAKVTILAASIATVVSVGVVVSKSGRMRAEVSVQKDEIARQQSEVSVRRAEINRQNKEMSAQHEQIERRSKEIASHREEIARQQETIKSQSKEIVGKIGEIERQRDEIVRPRKVIDQRAQEVARQAKEITGQIEAHALLTGNETNFVSELKSLRQFKTGTENMFEKVKRETLFGFYRDNFSPSRDLVSQARIIKYKMGKMATVDKKKVEALQSFLDKLVKVAAKEDSLCDELAARRMNAAEKAKKGLDNTEESLQIQKIHEDIDKLCKTEATPLYNEIKAIHEREKRDSMWNSYTDGRYTDQMKSEMNGVRRKVEKIKRFADNIKRDIAEIRVVDAKKAEELQLCLDKFIDLDAKEESLPQKIDALYKKAKEKISGGRDDTEEFLLAQKIVKEMLGLPNELSRITAELTDKRRAFVYDIKHKWECYFTRKCHCVRRIQTKRDIDRIAAVDKAKAEELQMLLERLVELDAKHNLLREKISALREKGEKKAKKGLDDIAEFHQAEKIHEEECRLFEADIKPLADELNAKRKRYLEDFVEDS